MLHRMVLFWKATILASGLVAPQNTVYTSRYELSFFRNAVDFSTANASCADMGTTLVTIDGAEVTNAINKAVPLQRDGINGHAYWIGATDIKSEGKWIWLDGSKAGKNEGVYHNWRDNQPDNYCNEDCVVTAFVFYKWTDVKCGRKHYYICQKVRPIAINLSPTSVEVQNDGMHQVNCTSVGYPTETVEWYRADELVSLNEMTSVFQNTFPGSSILRLQNADISDAGIYRCLATNTIQGREIEVSQQIKVKVAGNPTIRSIDDVKCNSSLVINWEPNARAAGFEHRISVPAQGLTVRVNPPESKLINTLLNGLESFTTYVIIVTACVDTTCSGEYRAEQQATTRGILRGPTSVQANTSTEGRCVARWQISELVLPSDISGFEVYLVSTLSRTRQANPDSDTETVPLAKDSLSYSFNMKPNRKYTVFVAVENCTGLSKDLMADGSCVSQAKAPATLSPIEMLPTRNDDGTWTLILAPPDESNGLISCLIIFVKFGKAAENEAGDNPMVTMDNIWKASNDTQNSHGYIAAAIQVSRFFIGPGQSIKWLLGSGESTSCNVAEAEVVSRKRREIHSNPNSTITATNLKLDEGESYSVLAISATPTDDGRVLLMQSRPTTFEYFVSPSDAELQGSTPAIAASVCVLVLLIGIIIAAVLLRRRALKRTGEDAETGPEQNQHDRVVYENFQPERQEEQPQPRSPTEIRMTDFEAVYNSMRKNTNSRFLEQFQKILEESTKNMPSATFASNPNLKKKNRYKNILPFDCSRVPVEGNETGYINANFINGFNRNAKFIATQGPLSGTVNDFWLMVVEQRCTVIVMLTRGVEAAKKKCEIYWPESGKTIQYGIVCVEAREEISYRSYIRRIFLVTLCDGPQSDPLVITHYQFMKWPDHGVPHTTSDLIRMYRAVVKSQSAVVGNTPTIVHCSAGAGRSGTFIGYDILVNEFKGEDAADVFKCICDMRQQRVEMVQNCDQYILLHKLVLETYLFGDTDMEANQVERKLKNPEGGINREVLLSEFKNLTKVIPMKNEMSYGLLSENKKMNRSKDIIPYDYCMVKLSQSEIEADRPYINASWIESYDESNPMIAAQGPMENTVEYFWRAILDNKVEVIVMLAKTVEDKKEQCAQYWPTRAGDTMKIGSMTIKLLQERAETGIIERKLVVEGIYATKTVSQLHYMGCKADTCPENDYEVIDMIRKMQKHCRDAGKGVALIHCSDGAGRTGAFCAIVNLLERLKLENRVDVFRAVKDLRDGRPGMVQTLDQYVFCYQAVVDYLKSFELYSNF